MSCLYDGHQTKTELNDIAASVTSKTMWIYLPMHSCNTDDRNKYNQNGSSKVLAHNWHEFIRWTYAELVPRGPFEHIEWKRIWLFKKIALKVFTI